MPRVRKKRTFSSKPQKQLKKQKPVFSIKQINPKGKGHSIKFMLKQNMKSEFSNRFDNAIRDVVKLKVISNRKSLDDSFRAVTTETKYPSESEIHYQNILKLEKIKPFSTSRLAVRCSCSDFAFTFHHVLGKAGAGLYPADPLVISDFPWLRNPGGYKAVCKHLIVVFEYILKKNL